MRKHPSSCHICEVYPYQHSAPALGNLAREREPSGPGPGRQWAPGKPRGSRNRLGKPALLGTLFHFERYASGIWSPEDSGYRLLVAPHYEQAQSSIIGALD